MLAIESRFVVGSAIVVEAVSVPLNIADEEFAVAQLTLVVASDLERVNLKPAKENQHLTVTNDFHSHSCKTDFPTLSLARIVVAAHGGDGDDGASNGDACETADTLVECFECLTFALEPPVELSSNHSMTSV